MLQNVAIYPTESQVFYREHDDGAYSTLAFFMAYTTLEIPFEILASLLFALLSVIAPGLQRTPQLFFVAAFNSFAIVNCGESVGIMFNTLFHHTGFAVNVMATLLSLANIMGGVMSLDIPPFLQAWNHLNPVKWSLGNLAPWTLGGVVFSCVGGDGGADGGGGCGPGVPRTGDDVLRLYHLDANPELNLMALGICVVVYRFVAWGVLTLKRGRWRGALTRWRMKAMGMAK
ncbi:MAG: hypothetical protein Q9196_007497, partial [Gyalolechia fulgens]